jgi:hypothetical protein
MCSLYAANFVAIFFLAHGMKSLAQPLVHTDSMINVALTEVSLTQFPTLFLLMSLFFRAQR